MAIVELRVRHPYQYGVVGRWDEETEGKEATLERIKGLDDLNNALNQGFAVIDTHSISGYRLYLLHKTTQKEARDAEEAEFRRTAIEAGIDPDTGLTLENK